MSGFRVDHLVIRVDDLSRAIGDYAALGFTVVPGGEHPGQRSRNALIALADGAYLELIAFEQGGAPDSSAGGRIRRWRTAPEGFVDFAVLPEGIEEAISGAARRGVDLLGPLAGGRVRPDGVTLSWRAAFPDRPDLPFLCADVTPRRLRVPEGAARTHRNGAAGISALTVEVSDLERSVRRYRGLLGAEPLSGPAPAFVLGSTTIRLVSGDDTAAGREGLCAATLRTGDRSRAGVLAPALAHGARLELA